MLVGCGGAQTHAELTYAENAERAYNQAIEPFDNHDCVTATPLFQTVRREYPYSRFGALAELRLADCEIDQQHYSEAIRQYRAFIRQRPTHREIPYAQFRVVLGYFKQVPTEFVLSPPPEERDLAPARTALRVVRRFLRDYAESDHRAEAERIQEDVTTLLARHELYAARYYLSRDKAPACIGRVRALLRDFPGNRLEAEAHLLLARTYMHTRDRARARAALTRMIENYSGTGFDEQANRYLIELGPPASDEPEVEDEDWLIQPRPPEEPETLEPEPEPEPAAAPAAAPGF